MHLSRADRQVLDDASISSRSVHAGRDIMREGEEADRLCFVVDGWACRFKTTRDGGRQIVTLMVPGDAANLDSLLFARLDYGVRALTETTVLSLSRQHALALAAKHPGIARAFTWLALVENATLSQWALSLGRHSAQQRLAHLFCELSVRADEHADGRSSFELPLTQEQIADALGLTAVHVNRTLRQLRAEGLVVMGGRSITIPDVARLRRVGDFDPAYLHHLPEEPGSPMPA